jgi:ABC-2 type transport system permease protein
MQRLLILTRSILLMKLRNRATLFWGFAFPVGLIVLYGAIWGGQQFGPVRAMTWLMVGVVVLNIMASAFVGDSGWLADARSRGILQRVHAAPISSATLISAYILARLVLMLLQSALIMAVAIIAFGAEISWAGLLLGVPWMLFGALVFIAIGQAIGAATPSLAATTVVGQALYFPLMFLSNLFMPIDLMPAWLAAIARWNPAYLLVDLLRPTFTLVPADHATWVKLACLLGYGLLGMIIAAATFRWEPRR